jgi:UDP-N-acetylmuramoyl-L-alanyl-D-glutamate--2,6-diaminopimelate ligase
LRVLAVVGDDSTPIAHLTYDSRQVRPGSAFVAYAGVHENVHDYIPDAVARGATVVVAEEQFDVLTARLTTGTHAAQPTDSLSAGATSPPDLPVLVRVPDARLARGWMAARLHGHPSRSLTVVGVTGTDGKTTTATLIHAIAQAAGLTAGLITTVGARIGDTTLDTGLHVTTPEPEELQAYLAAIRDAGAEVAVLEVTSHALVQHRVAGVDFDIAVVTNITREALELHGTFDAYVDAKALLFEALTPKGRTSPRSASQVDSTDSAMDVNSRMPPRSKPPIVSNPTAVLNACDPSFDRLTGVHAARQVAYAALADCAAGADFTAHNVTADLHGIEFTLEAPGVKVQLKSPLVGEYNVANILAAVAAGAALGAPPEAWQRGVAIVSGVPGRMETVQAGDFLAMVDFAHTPNALRAALSAARTLTANRGRVIAVFGCAGLRDPGKRDLMGRVAGELADFTVVTAEDPRSERFEDIAARIAMGLIAAGRRETEGYSVVADRGQAILEAVRRAEHGDVVLVCGKGHERSMAFGDTEFPWDDRDALRAALRGSALGGLPTSPRGQS